MPRLSGPLAPYLVLMSNLHSWIFEDYILIFCANLTNFILHQKSSSIASTTKCSPGWSYSSVNSAPRMIVSVPPPLTLIVYMIEHVWAANHCPFVDWAKESVDRRVISVPCNIASHEMQSQTLQGAVPTYIGCRWPWSRRNRSEVDHEIVGGLGECQSVPHEGS